MDTKVRIWDPLIRIFHWSLVTLFGVAYLTEGEPETLHIWAGYGIGMLLVFRLVWGLIGTRYARFSSFVTTPTTTLRYLKQIFIGKAKRHLGHNPAGAAMIIALILSVGFTVISGMALLGTEGEGPLAATFLAGLPEDPVEEVHEFFANASVLLIMLHVAGVLIASWQHRENLIRSMWNGYKSADTTSATSSHHQGDIRHDQIS